MLSAKEIRGHSHSSEQLQQENRGPESRLEDSEMVAAKVEGQQLDDWIEIFRTFLSDRGVENVDGVIDKLETTNTMLLYRLIKGDFGGEPTTFDTEWRKFTENNREWSSRFTQLSDSKSSSPKKRRMDLSAMENFTIIFFAVHEDIPNLLVIRKQNSGLCCMNAPVVLQHYMVAISTNGTKNGILNLGRYEANQLTGEDLVQFLLQKQGKFSEMFLESICGISSSDISTIMAPNPNCENYKLFLMFMYDIAGKIAQGSPALVSGFKAYKDFESGKGGRQTFTGNPLSIPGNELVGLHAMILIGIRKVVPSMGPSFGASSTSDEDNPPYPGFFFLLQNWWEDKYFVEVDAEYLYHCRATISFIRTPLTDYNLKHNLDEFVSPFTPFTESFDKPETRVEETI